MSAVFDKVKNIIALQLDIDVEDITIDASFMEDLGTDSIDTVELIMAFETEFGIDIPEDEIEGLQTVDNVIKYIESKL